MPESKKPWAEMEGLEGDQLFDAVFAFCVNEICTIKAELRIFRGLFSDDVRRVDAFNKSSNFMASLFQDLLFDDLVARVCRILDPATDRFGNRNLGVKLLVDYTQALEKEKWQNKVEIALAASGDLRDRRNKHLSHNDLRAKQATVAVGWVSLQNIQTVVDAIEEVLMSMARDLRETHLEMEPVSNYPELQFLRALHAGNEALDSQKREYIDKIVADRTMVPDFLSQIPTWLRAPYMK